MCHFTSDDAKTINVSDQIEIRPSVFIGLSILEGLTVAQKQIEVSLSITPNRLAGISIPLSLINRAYD